MPPVKLQVVMSIPGKEPREFEYEFDQERVTIGRDQTNDIQVPLSTVSRAHCVFSFDNKEWYLEDLKSTHGTKHNTRPMAAGAKKLLRDGDVIDLVHFKMTFVAEKVRSPDYSAEKTEALARKMVEEVLAQIGNDASSMPYLRVMNGPEEGKKLVIGPDISEATIGRGTDCDFQINDANVSRRHAIIRRDWNEITVEDAGSKNGVVVNERRITRAVAMRDADEIMLGQMKLTFIDPSAKFLGKLDDIPAFQSQPTSAEQEAFDPASAADPDAMPEPGDQSAPAPRPMDEPAPQARPQPAAQGPRSTMQSQLPADDFGPEPGPFEDDIPPPRGLGALEIGLIIAALVAVAGLGVGVALLVSS